jgi:hypothetical protein
LNYCRFLKQRRGAKYRGIAWELTFTEWLEWWGDDIKLRGKMKSSLCMCRHGDVGAYNLENIYKGTVSDNVSTARRRQ